MPRRTNRGDRGIGLGLKLGYRRKYARQQEWSSRTDVERYRRRSDGTSGMNYTMEGSRMTAARCRSGGTPCPPEHCFSAASTFRYCWAEKASTSHYVRYLDDALARQVVSPATGKEPQSGTSLHTCYIPATYLERGPTKEATSKNLKAREFVVPAFIVECSRTIRRIHPQA